MPQDSTYIIASPNDTAQTTSPQLAKALHAYHEQELQPKPEKPKGGLTGFLIIILIFAAFLLPMKWKSIRGAFKRKKALQTINEKWLEYDGLLHWYIPYYRKLNPSYKEQFMASKQFEFSDMKKEEYMTLLISAAAVQLTFGLKHYLLDYFDTIYVLPNVYHFGLSAKPFEGHINSDGIYLSWNKFLEEFIDPADGQNVGLHEMAHALTYVNFTAEDGQDHDFKRRFRDFAEVGRPVFEKMQAGETAFLGDYASTNYEEFWAVSVENFFERPSLFRAEMPEVYAAMCKLLNQDLLSANLIIEPIEDV